MKKEKEDLFLSEYERREIMRNRLYKLLPILSMVILVALWLLAS